MSYDCFSAPVMDQTGCSDGITSDLSSVISEFSSTPNMSVCSTPEPSPDNKEKGVRGPETSSTPAAPTPKQGVRSKGKDLSLLIDAKTVANTVHPRIHYISGRKW